jgi:hypothetical protein
MIGMLTIGYVFAMERALCRKVQVNLAYRWFCGLSIEDKIRITQRFQAAAPSSLVHTTVRSPAGATNFSKQNLPKAEIPGCEGPGASGSRRQLMHGHFSAYKCRVT